MFLKILTAFIILFVVMLVIGLIRGKGRTKASAGDAARETRKLQSFDDMIAEYEREPDHGSITEDQYYYCCYMTGKKINGYDLKKAVMFQTTCEVRGIRDIGGMKNILKYDELYGDIDVASIDCKEFYDIGAKTSEIVERIKGLTERNRSEIKAWVSTLLKYLF